MMNPGYDERFFEDIGRTADRSAARVVPDLVDLLRPRSVLDVGCGTGVWLRAFLDAGVERVLGIDGAHVPVGELRIPTSDFLATDLESIPTLDRQFDLAISLEVVEHLTASASDAVVALLARSAPAILFSGAVPGQGGRGHINEQWLDHWVGRFEAHDLEAVDVLRSRYWDDTEVGHFYAQNLVLFLRPGHPARSSARALGQALPWRLVHPGTLAHHVKKPGVGDLLRAVPDAVRRTVNARRQRR